MAALNHRGLRRRRKPPEGAKNVDYAVFDLALLRLQASIAGLG